MRRHQPLVQANRVFLFGHRLDDRPLHAGVEMRPARAKAIFVAESGEYLVAGQARAIVARLVKALTIGEFQQSCQRGMEAGRLRSEEHKSELQSLMRISYAIFCLKKKK